MASKRTRKPRQPKAPPPVTPDPPQPPKIRIAFSINDGPYQREQTVQVGDMYRFTLRKKVAMESEDSLDQVEETRHYSEKVVSIKYLGVAE